MRTREQAGWSDSGSEVRNWRGPSTREIGDENEGGRKQDGGEGWNNAPGEALRLKVQDKADGSKVNGEHCSQHVLRHLPSIKAGVLGLTYEGQNQEKAESKLLRGGG